MNLYNGIATLNVNLPDNSKVGETHHYILSVTDDSRPEPFKESFAIIVDDQQKSSGGGKGKRSKGREEKGKGKREDKSQLSLPNIKEVFKKDWEMHHFDEKSALKIDNNGENGYDFYVNSDNIHLNTEIKNRKSESTSLIRRKYMYGMVLIGLSMINDTDKDTLEIENDPEKQAESFARKISPILIPMIDNLGSLDDD